MQRFVNDPSRIVDDMLVGFLRNYSSLLAPTNNPRVVKTRMAGEKGRVGIVTGGGSGHKPAFVGYLVYIPDPDHEWDGHSLKTNSHLDEEEDSSDN